MAHRVTLESPRRVPLEDCAFDVGLCDGADSQVMTMPRGTEEILAQADELARMFEDYDPKPGDRERMSPEFRLRVRELMSR